MQEHKVSETAYFVTLTYNTPNLPFTDRGYKTLSKEDLRKFFKRLRKLHNKKGIRINQLKLPPKFRIKKKKIKFYACGEYGTRHKRPHYHAIVFNAHENDIYKAWNSGYDMETDERGTIYVGTVTQQSCRYVMKYMSKEFKKPYPYPCDSVPEYTTQSNGLGRNYLSDAVIKWHKADYNRNYLPNGKYKVSMPRYYRDLIWKDEYEKRNMLHHIASEAEITYLADKKDAEDQGYTLQRLFKHRKNAEYQRLKGISKLRN